MTGGRISIKSANRGRTFIASTGLGHHSIAGIKHQNPKQGDTAVFLIFVMLLLGSRTRTTTTGEEDTGLGAIR